MQAGQTSASDRDATGDRAFFRFNAALSAGALAFLTYILVLRKPEATHGVDLSFLPTVNACLNGTAALCLVAGYLAIRRKQVLLHKFMMASAFGASSLFLVSYLLYHYVHGDTRYQGTGPLRVVYLSLLASHVLLSTAVVPLALTSFYFAWRKSFARHRKVAKVTLPIWLYVSVTGVLVYVMLRGSYGA